MIRRIVFIGSLALALAACSNDGGSTDDGGPGDDGGSSVTLDQACADQAAAECAYLHQCGELGWEVDYGSDAECQKALTTSCTFYSSFADSNVTASDVSACASAFATASCDAYWTGGACATIPGNRATGAACQTGGQCASGYCAIASAGACGVCADWVELGGACGAGKACDYANGLYCSTSGKCVAYAKQGAACGPGVFCGYGLTCVGGKCGTGAQLGQACSGTSPCDASKPLECDSKTSKCVSFTYVPVGKPCDIGAGDVCVEGSCKVTSGSVGTCIADLDQGATCTQTGIPICKTPYQCGASGTCDLPADLGCQ